MPMFTNGPPPKPLPPGPECSFADGRDGLRRKCAGNLHEYDVQMFADVNGNPVKDAPKEKTFICELHYPDPDDPKFLLCTCRLCKERKGLN